MSRRPTPCLGCGEPCIYLRCRPCYDAKRIVDARELRESRFWSHVDRSGGPDACWPWTASRRTDGYGHLNVWTESGDKYLASHRVALAYHLGRPIAAGLVAMHSCDNRPCCNPRHLSEGTQADNLHDMQAKGRKWVSTRTAA